MILGRGKLAEQISLFNALQNGEMVVGEMYTTMAFGS
jgi:hypothetical protein